VAVAQVLAVAQVPAVAGPGAQVLPAWAAWAVEARRAEKVAQTAVVPGAMVAAAAGRVAGRVAACHLHIEEHVWCSQPEWFA
jgi:hypothetical protein